MGTVTNASYTPTPAPPARLDVVLARNAPVGVIMRRGPSAWYQLILWHTDADTFEYGQWFHGSLYGGELSPDGSKFLYYAAKFHRRKGADLYDWVAISTPPYLTALALWSRTEVPGLCLFLDDHTLLIQGSSKKPNNGSIPAHMKVILDSKQKRNVYYERQALHGWQLQQERIWRYPPGELVQPRIWKKGNNNGNYSILLADRDLHAARRYFIRNEERDQTVELPGVSWADWDHHGRFVYASDGMLFSREPILESSTPIMLSDFNSERYVEVIAPEWAVSW